MKKTKPRDLAYGILLGTALLAPGLSVGTIALVIGIYDKLLTSISDFFSSRYKEALKFLIPLGIGAVVAILISSRVISWSYDHFEIQTYSLFLGMVVGSIPLLLKSSNAKERFKSKQLVILFVVMALVALFRLVEPAEADPVITSLTWVDGLWLFLTGGMISVAMLLPGLSAALILMLMGTHSMLTHALSDLNLPIIAAVMAGALVGLILSSRGIKYLLRDHMDNTNAASIGMVLGSIVVLIPAYSLDFLELGTSLTVFVLGYFTASLLNLARK